MRLILAAMVLAALPAAAQEEAAPEAGTETVVERSEHRVVRANTLWDLAEHFYKDPWQWPRIYEANKDQIRDPHWIYPNQILVIPGFETVRVIKKDQPEPAPEPPAPPAAEPELGSPAPPVDYVPNRAAGAVALPESLSTKLPSGMTSGQPSAFRMLMPKDWKPHGRIVVLSRLEGLAAEGDEVRLRLDEKAEVRRGTRFTVWRMAAPTEADLDQKATYTQKIGVVEAVKRVGEKEYRARVLRSGGTVQVGDLVTLGE